MSIHRVTKRAWLPLANRRTVSTAEAAILTAAADTRVAADRAATAAKTAADLEWATVVTGIYEAGYTLAAVAAASGCSQQNVHRAVLSVRA